MGEHTAIEWADHTFNPVIGCQKVSAACDFCYAETLMDTRLGRVEWGPHGERKRTSAANWRQPLKWNRAAEAAGIRARVFCASLADVFDTRWPAGARADLWQLIDETPHLIWMLLTKRPQNIAKMLPADVGTGNVWLGTTVENQDEARKRIPALCANDAAVHFLSCEPLLGDIRLDDFPEWPLDWIIVGGESGAHARPMHPDWPRSIRDQCQDAGVPFFMKQMTKKATIPDDLFIREFPNADT